MKIKVLGAGCSCCNQLYANVEEALYKMELDMDVEFVHDISEALKYEILQLPALIIDEKVISSGSDMSVEEITKIIKSYNK